MESQIKEGGRRRDLEKSLSKKIGRAIADYGMIKDGDRILVAVSGGKDSLTLLKLLSERKKFVPIRYDILALHVDLGYRCVNKDVLKKFLEDNGYPYHFKKLDILKGKRRKDITCFWCSWNRRKALFEAAQTYGCSTIALGHHKDDIAQTIQFMLITFRFERPSYRLDKRNFSFVAKHLDPGFDPG